MNWGRWAIILGVIFALYFAFQGGEYGTLDLRELRKQAAQESTAVVQLQHVLHLQQQSPAEHSPVLPPVAVLEHEAYVHHSGTRLIASGAARGHKASGRSPALTRSGTRSQFPGMPRHPPEKDRRSSERQKPAYTPKEIQELQVTRVHFREDFLFCLLSDGSMNT